MPKLAWVCCNSLKLLKLQLCAPGLQFGIATRQGHCQPQGMHTLLHLPTSHRGTAPDQHLHSQSSRCTDIAARKGWVGRGECQPGERRTCKLALLLGSAECGTKLSRCSKLRVQKSCIGAPKQLCQQLTCSWFNETSAQLHASRDITSTKCIHTFALCTLIHRTVTSGTLQPSATATQHPSCSPVTAPSTMDSTDDPYHLIKSEIDNELQQVTSLQAKLFAGHGEVASSLNSRLQAAAEQLQALESAVQSMVAEPSKYGLTAAAAFGRQVCTQASPLLLSSALC